MKDILILGGVGYIGSHIARELIKYNQKIILYDDLSNTNILLANKLLAEGKNIKFEKGNILDFDNLKTIFSKYNIGTIIFLAAKISVEESNENPIKYYETNIKGLINVIKLLEKYNIDNLIFSSTASLYGKNNNKILNENNKIQIINQYALTKKIGEELIQNSAEKLKFNYIIFRFFNVAGASEDSYIGPMSNKVYHIIPVINETILGIRDTLYIFGNDYETEDGYCVRDYIHVEDIARAHILALKFLKENNRNNIINLGTEKGVSVKEIILKAEKIFNKKIRYKLLDRRKGDPDFLVASNRKAREIIGWKPQKNIDNIIIDDYNWRKTLK